MCMADGDGEPPDFYSASHPTARKAHRCGECRRDIEPGERYWRVSGKWDGDLETFKTCLHCETAAGWLQKRCDGYLLGMIVIDLREHWDIERVREPGLFQLLRCIRRKWRTREGALIEIGAIKQVVDLAEAA